MKPIQFSTEMVKAILDGRKTQTRRVIKPQPDGDVEIPDDVVFNHQDPKDGTVYGGKEVMDFYHYGVPDIEWVNFPVVPKYKVGDILYVKEAFFPYYPYDYKTHQCIDVKYDFKADYLPEYRNYKWKSPRYMPKKAARIFLEVTDVRVEKLQEIEVCDIIREGSLFFKWENKPENTCKALTEFANIWDTLNNKKGYGWDTNPFVAVITFKRTEKPKEAE